MKISADWMIAGLTSALNPEIYELLKKTTKDIPDESHKIVCVILSSLLENGVLDKEAVNILDLADTLSLDMCTLPEKYRSEIGTY